VQSVEELATVHELHPVSQLVQVAFEGLDPVTAAVKKYPATQAVDASLQYEPEELNVQAVGHPVGHVKQV